ncbi:MAG: glycosyltransferase family 39 protein [Limisphaerales bacterium]
MPRLQELIHALEVGAGARYLRIVAIFLGIVTVSVAYNLREFKNFHSEEAMDAAQVARNLAEGRGFTTRCIRPLSMGVLIQNREDRSPMIKGTEHPDLANPPLYPLVLAGFMKIPGLFNHEIASQKESVFRRHQPDFVIAFINQGFFFIAVILSWRLARRLFDDRVALLTALALIGCDLLWQFSASGLPTMLALALFTALLNVLTDIDAGSRREPPMGAMSVLVLAVLAGLLTGGLLLTRYALGVLIVPVLLFLATGTSGRRVLPSLLAVAAFAAVISPWLVRNWQVCGNPFGIAPYSIVQETATFSGNWLDRVLEPDVSKVSPDEVLRKFFIGASSMIREELPQLGGSWLTAFFLVGFLVPFVDPVRSRMRWFTVGALVFVAAAQILSRTHLSLDTPRINSENLIVLLTPLAFMFGMALVALLVFSLEVSVEVWRTFALTAVVLISWIPLALAFGPPRTSPIVYPPYYPPTIQRVSQWFEPSELMMSDMPWAVAWYGNRPAVLLSASPDKEFLDISDWHKTVDGLYLTRITLDERFLSGWVLNARKWGRFIIEILTRGEVPKGFPLRQAPSFLTTFPDHVLLADRNRWQESLPIAPPKGLDPLDPVRPAGAPAADRVLPSPDPDAPAGGGPALPNPSPP